MKKCKCNINYCFRYFRVDVGADFKMLSFSSFGLSYTVDIRTSRVVFTADL